MRLWTLHPKYLDRQGLLALWREGLLAQKVLEGRTKGYVNHPQLRRFREQSDPVAAISTFLVAVHEESIRRGYRFDASKIGPRRTARKLPETTGQLMFEWAHLRSKLTRRSLSLESSLRSIATPEPHPMFRIGPGGVSAERR